MILFNYQKISESRDDAAKESRDNKSTNTLLCGNQVNPSSTEHTQLPNALATHTDHNSKSVIYVFGHKLCFKICRYDTCG